MRFTTRASRLTCPLAMLLLWSGCSGPMSSPTRADTETAIVTVEDSFQLDQPSEHWTFRTPDLWKIGIEGDRRFLQILEPPARPMMPGVRRPQEYAIYNRYEWRNFWLSFYVRVDRPVNVAGRDACVILGRQDNTHFYYVHLSGLSDALHTSVVRVDGDTRQSLVGGPFPPPPLTDRQWHRVDILRNYDDGTVIVKVDAPQEDKPPLFNVVDRTYEWGFVGLASFDDYASFASVLIQGQARRPGSPLVTDPAAPAGTTQ